MMSRNRSVSFVVAAIALSGCTVPLDPSTNTVQAIQAEMRGIAAQYAADKQRGGMAAVVSDIQNCYSSSTSVIVLQHKLRACMILDATAAMEDMRASRDLGQSLPYFTEATKEARWRHYWPIAGFPNANAAIDYMVTGAKMVEADEAVAGRPTFEASSVRMW